MGTPRTEARWIAPGKGFEPLPRAAARRTVVWFVVFGVAWILATDLLVRVVFEDPGTRAIAETAKGWLFVAVSAGLLAGLLHREMRRGAAAESLLERFRHGFEVVFSTADEAMFVTGQDGRILEANRVAGVWLNRARASLRGQDLGTWLHFASEDALGQATRRWGALPGDAIIETGGPPRLVLLSVSPEIAPGLDLVMLHDVTEQRRLERRLRQVEQREAMGRIASGVAHDFNNLLTVIEGHCELGMGSLGSPELVEASLSEIRRSSERGVVLTRELLELGRGVDEERVTSISLDSLVDELVPSATTLLGEEYELVIERDGEAGWTRADPAQLERVVLNLLANARDASRDGASIRLATRTFTCDAKEGNPLGLAPGAFVSVSVADRGCGMDERTRQRIFEPYYSSKEHGTGLGLAIAERIVTDLGGAIHVDSAPGRGSRFEVVLPRIDPSGASR